MAELVGLAMLVKCLGFLLVTFALSLGKLWSASVGPASCCCKYRQALESETRKFPPGPSRCRHTHSFWILSWNSASWLPLILLTLWNFQCIALEPEMLWNRWFAWTFASIYSLLIPFFLWIWIYKTHDLTDYQVIMGRFLLAITSMGRPKQIPWWPWAAVISDNISLCALLSRLNGPVSLASFFCLRLGFWFT